MLGIQQTPQPTSSSTFQGGNIGTSGPFTQNTDFNSGPFPKPSAPPQPTYLDRLPLELKFTLMEFSDPADLITLWDLSDSFKHALRSQHAIKQWNRMRRAAGEPSRPTRPTPQEFKVLRYAVEEGCQACTAREAPRQWHWGTRICVECLPSKVLTRRQFRQYYGTLFKSLGGAVQRIRWFNPAEVPGLEHTQIAVRSLNPVQFENPDDVALRDWVDAAVKAVHDVMKAKPNGSQQSIATDVEGLISGERRWAETTSELRWSQEKNPWEIERLGPKRSRQIASMLLDMRGLKFKREDIPGPEDHLWGKTAYKGTEFTLMEWENVKGPLVRAVKKNRDDRLASVFQAHIPPTPSSVVIRGYQGPEGIAGIEIGPLPAAVFLKICANLDLATVSALEKTSKNARMILQSRAADYVWRAIRLSVGLTASFEGWPEREFLACVMRRHCTGCGKEGLNFPRLVSVLCGDCFQFNAISHKTASRRIAAPILKAMVSLQAQPYIDISWLDNSGYRGVILQPSYLTALAGWANRLPKALKQSIPDDLLEKHIRESKIPFLNVAKQCEEWQKTRDPLGIFMRQRREAWFLRAVASTWPGVGVQAMLQCHEWKEIVRQGYPASNREWKHRKQSVFEMLCKNPDPTAQDEGDSANAEGNGA